MASELQDVGNCTDLLILPAVTRNISAPCSCSCLFLLHLRTPEKKASVCKCSHCDFARRNHHISNKLDTWNDLYNCWDGKQDCKPSLKHLACHGHDASAESSLSTGLVPARSSACFSRSVLISSKVVFISLRSESPGTYTVIYRSIYEQSHGKERSVKNLFTWRFTGIWWMWHTHKLTNRHI